MYTVVLVLKQINGCNVDSIELFTLFTLTTLQIKNLVHIFNQQMQQSIITLTKPEKIKEFSILK